MRTDSGQDGGKVSEGISEKTRRERQSKRAAVPAAEQHNQRQRLPQSQTRLPPHKRSLINAYTNDCTTDQGFGQDAGSVPAPSPDHGVHSLSELSCLAAQAKCGVTAQVKAAILYWPRESNGETSKAEAILESS